ncbi:MAG: uracil-DNA glycosylase [Chloroflexia bacterium]
MEGRTRVFGVANGNIDASVLFVAEAPGRLGGDKTGVPLTSDQTGRNFERLLVAGGIERSEIFVTNGVLCNPRDAKGNNAPPSRQEIRNCAPHLAATIEIVQPRYVVSLGVVALRALDLVCAHPVVLAQNVGKPIRWHGRVLVPLYHPGPRAMIHRPMAVQMEDYRQLGALVKDHASEATI